MTFFTRQIVALFSLLTAFNAVADLNNVNFSGEWINQRDSILILENVDDSGLKGTFTTAVANTQSCVGKAVPINGIHNGNAAAFSLSMESCGSPVAIAFSGTLQIDENNKETLSTMYLVQWKGEDTWKSRVIGTDTFVRADK